MTDSLDFTVDGQPENLSSVLKDIHSMCSGNMFAQNGIFLMTAAKRQLSDRGMKAARVAKDVTFLIFQLCTLFSYNKISTVTF